MMVVGAAGGAGRKSFWDGVSKFKLCYSLKNIYRDVDSTKDHIFFFKWIPRGAMTQFESMNAKQTRSQLSWNAPLDARELLARKKTKRWDWLNDFTVILKLILFV